MANYATTPRTDLTSMGTKVAYAFETIAHTRPTTGWTHIPGISAIPAMNQQPEIIDTTTLDELTARVGKPGLKALPSATNFTANMTPELVEQWETDVMPKYKAALAEGKAMWITIVVEGMPKAFYFTAEPSPLDVPAISVGSVLSMDTYITPTSERTMDTPPTSISAWEKSIGD